MKFPLQSTMSIGKYVAAQQRKGQRYPLVLMLEPTLACNIACIGCGKIREYESNRARLSVEECLDAGLQCPAPVVSICGGEPLVFKGIEEVAAGMIEMGKTVELCTNALRLEQCLDWFEPSARMTFVVHLDGMREIHDYVCDYPGLWEIAVDAIFWERHQRMSPREFARELLRMARYVKLSRDPKTKCGSKEPQPRKKSGERNRHISAARLLAEAGAK